MIVLKSLTQLDGKLSCKLYSKVNSVGIDKFSSSELQDDMDKQIINKRYFFIFYYLVKKTKFTTIQEKFKRGVGLMVI